MRFNGVIPFWQHPMGLQIDLSLLLRSDFHSGRIIGSVEPSTASESAHGFGCADELQCRLIADQWLPSPVLTDETEHPMLNRIPFGSACWQMSDCEVEVKLIGQWLQAEFPQPTAITIATATISFHQQSSSPQVTAAPFTQPPGADGRDYELRGLMRCTENHEAAILPHVGDPIRDGNSISGVRVIVFQHVQRLLPPRTPSRLEVANQLAFLRVNPDHRITSFEKLAPLSRHVPHLPVAIRVLFFGHALAIRSQDITGFREQATHCFRADLIAATRQFSAQLANRLARPFDAGDRITSRGIPQQFVQHLQDSRLFFSTICRPPPARRIWLRVARGSRRLSSSRPRQMVLRLNPVISINRWIPPCCAVQASKPTKRRRLFSSSVASKRLIARCSFAGSLRDCCRQVSHVH